MGTKKNVSKEIQMNVSAWHTGRQGFGCIDRWVEHTNGVNEQGAKREKEEGEERRRNQKAQNGDLANLKRTG